MSLKEAMAALPAKTAAELTFDRGVGYLYLLYQIGF